VDGLILIIPAHGLTWHFLGRKGPMGHSAKFLFKAHCIPFRKIFSLMGNNALQCGLPTINDSWVLQQYRGRNGRRGWRDLHGIVDCASRPVISN
jgi:hypothetical protein